MKPIDADEYFDLIMKGFSHLDPGETDEMTYFMEDIFKLRWLTRVRFNTFVTLAEELDMASFQRFRMVCLQITSKGRSKMGEPSVCNAVAICEGVAPEVVEYAQKRPAKHANMSEYPVIIDLKGGEAHYYTGPILYGILYAQFEREYIESHFALPLRALKERKATP